MVSFETFPSSSKVIRGTTRLDHRSLVWRIHITNGTAYGQRRRLSSSISVRSNAGQHQRLRPQVANAVPCLSTTFTFQLTGQTNVVSTCYWREREKRERERQKEKKDKWETSPTNCMPPLPSVPAMTTPSYLIYSVSKACFLLCFCFLFFTVLCLRWISFFFRYFLRWLL